MEKNIGISSKNFHYTENFREIDLQWNSKRAKWFDGILEKTVLWISTTLLFSREKNVFRKKQFGSVSICINALPLSLPIFSLAKWGQCLTFATHCVEITKLYHHNFSSKIPWIQFTFSLSFEWEMSMQVDFTDIFPKKKNHGE